MEVPILSRSAIDDLCTYIKTYTTPISHTDTNVSIPDPRVNDIWGTIHITNDNGIKFSLTIGKIQEDKTIVDEGYISESVFVKAHIHLTDDITNCMPIILLTGTIEDKSTILYQTFWYCSRYIRCTDCGAFFYNLPKDNNDRCNQCILQGIYDNTFSKGIGTCAVCKETIYQRDKEVLECTHTFHKACISKWISTNPSCPICRADVLPYNYSSIGYYYLESTTIPDELRSGRSPFIDLI